MNDRVFVSTCIITSILLAIFILMVVLTLSPRIKDLNVAQEDTANSLKEIKIQFNRIQTEFSRIKSELIVIQGKIKELQEYNDRLKIDISDLKTGIPNVQTDVDNLNTNFLKFKKEKK